MGPAGTRPCGSETRPPKTPATVPGGVRWDTAGSSTEVTTHAPLAHRLCPQTGLSSGPQTSDDFHSRELVFLGSEVRGQGPKEASSSRLPGCESP